MLLLMVFDAEVKFTIEKKNLVFLNAIVVYKIYVTEIDHTFFYQFRFHFELIQICITMIRVL